MRLAILPGLITASGYVGAVLSVGMVFPQLVTTLRNPGTGGVSAVSWALTAACSLTWLMYGFKAGVMPQIPGNVVIVPGAIAIVLTAPAAVAVTYRAAALASAIAAVFAAAMFLRPETLGYLAFAIGLVAAFPQTVKSALRSRSPGASAVSVTSWLMRALSQFFWLAYGLARRDFPIITGAGVTLVISLILLVTESRGQTRAPDAAAELSVSSLPPATRATDASR